MAVETARTRPRGRPKSDGKTQSETRDHLLRCGMEVLTEQGFIGTGLEVFLKKAEIPKGSFYYYFESKNEFGRAVIDAYGSYFSKKLARAFDHPEKPPLERIADFIEGAKKGMARHDYKRGCLIGNLSQELSGTDDLFRQQLEAVFADWESRVADVLKQAQSCGDLTKEADAMALAKVFWIGWEGAILRARLVRSSAPLDLFEQHFFAQLGATTKR